MKVPYRSQHPGAGHPSAGRECGDCEIPGRPSISMSDLARDGAL